MFTTFAVGLQKYGGTRALVNAGFLAALGMTSTFFRATNDSTFPAINDSFFQPQMTAFFQQQTATFSSHSGYEKLSALIREFVEDAGCSLH
jgi:hypothetical protein